MCQDEIAVTYRRYGLDASLGRIDWKWVTAVFLGMRLLISGIVVFTLWQSDPQPPSWALNGHPVLQAQNYAITSQAPAARLLLNGWYRWDTGWYLKIAALGYAPDDGSVSFQPLYPILIRVIQPLTGGNYLLAGLVISNIFCLLALGLFYKFAWQELGSEDEAQTAALLLISFPAAFFLFAGYTESLYLALALATWLLARRGSWIWAGLLSGLAVLARFQGIALIAPLGWLVLSGERASHETPIQEIRRVLRSTFSENGLRRLFSPKLWTPWLAVGMPAFTFLAYNIWLKSAGLGSVAGAYSDRRASIVPPWQGLWEFLGRIPQTKMLLSDWVDLALFFLFVGLAVLAIWKLRPALTLFFWATLTLVLMRGYSANLLSGFMRFMLTTFPVFGVLALVGSRHMLKSIAIVLFLCTQMILLWVFMNWIWVA